MSTLRTIAQRFGFQTLAVRWFSDNPCAPPGSKIRFNFPKEIEDSINEHITKEITAAYVYYSMASVFARDTLALHGFSKLFNSSAKDELRHTESWVDYMNMRGGKVKFNSIGAAPDVEWTPLTAVQKAIDMETKITQAIVDLRTKGEKHQDFHFVHFVEHNFLNEQIEELKKLGDLSTQVSRVGDDVGLYLLDYNLDKKYRRLAQNKSDDL